MNKFEILAWGLLISC
ncbi:putative phage replication protein, partial [Acinetobacter baumannii]